MRANTQESKPRRNVKLVNHLSRLLTSGREAALCIAYLTKTVSYEQFCNLYVLGVKDRGSFLVLRMLRSPNEKQTINNNHNTIAYQQWFPQHQEAPKMDQK
ncbi:hypothetical protein OS493_034895 [Desmophyllum pertusum]|uniref:Uncharacterized protein n=1 Tax=Desmophyllum pertusum TaxID=174260 RepID=A0A9W9ZA86_9CNID|nr:hypothetical protein OS493_034895 [Desmophyllum pertusum]